MDFALPSKGFSGLLSFDLRVTISGVYEMLKIVS
jgi:hypothetical protein